MKPQRLEIEGFTAFRERQAIELENLGLFAITGATGSGKTSILDAMTLALYGEVPRAEKGSGTLQDLISHGKRRAAVTFEFVSGSVRYRVQRKLPRTGSQEVLLHRWEEDKWKLDGARKVGETNARIEEIVGLDFDAFTRAVLLPQGAFGEFLTGKPDARRKILVRLMDLGRYERAGEQARRRGASEADKAAGRQQLISTEYGDATAEALAEAHRSAQACAARADVLAKLRGIVQGLVANLAGLDGIRQQIGRVVQELGTGNEQLTAVARTWVELRPQLEATESGTSEAEAARVSAEAARNAARAVRDETLQRTGDLGQIQGLLDAGDSLTRENESVARLGSLIAKGDAELTPLIARQQEAGQMADGATEAERQARAEADASKAQLLTADLLLQDAGRREKAAQQVNAALVLLDQAVLVTTQAAAAEATAAGMAESLRRKSVEVSHHSYAVALRAHLEPGQPCPVCEQTVERIPAGGEEAQVAIDTAEHEAVCAEKSHQVHQRTLGDARERETGCRATLEAAQKTLATFDATLTLEAATLARGSAAEANRLAQQAVNNAEALRRSADAAKEGAGRAVVEAETNLQRRREHLAEACARRDRAARILQQAFPAGVPEDFHSVLERRRTELRAAEEGLARAEELLTEVRERKDRADKELVRQRATSAELDRRLAAAQSVLSARADDLRRLGAGDKVGACPETSGLDETIQLLTPWGEAAYAVAKQMELKLEQEVTDVQGRIRSELEAASVSAQASSPAAIAAELQRVAEAARTDAVHAAAKVENLATRIQARCRLEEQEREARDRARHYGALAAELKADRFINYVLRESLEQLALQASIELRAISGDRYSLKADEGSFRVVDHANADEERSVATLSGGETFLASLSLALALSTGLTALAGHAASSRLEAIFIDEGFGSLDPDTLEIVVDALERLQGGERTVGVITHVPALAERIQAGLSVSRGASGSTVLSR